MNILYTPSGRAGEYADHGYAINYYTGCPVGCNYCYSPGIARMNKDDYHREAAPKKDVIVRLQRDLNKLGILPEPIFLSFLHDPYPAIERELQLTHQVIKTIKDSGNNVQILTKKPLLARQDFNLLGKEDAFAVTLTCSGEVNSRQWEPNGDSPRDRLMVLREAQHLGIRTWASFEPVIKPEWTLGLMRDAANMGCGFFKIGKMNYFENLLPEPIDWRKFAIDAATLAEKLGVQYMLKADLRAFLQPGDLPEAMLPTGGTVGDFVEPQINHIYETGAMPAALPGLGSNILPANCVDAEVVK